MNAARAAQLSVGTSLSIAFVWTWYSYGYLRCDVVFPTVLQYQLILFFAMGLFGGPVIIMIALAQILLNRSISPLTHLKLLGVIIAMALITSEGWILNHDISLPFAPSLTPGGEARCFPFGFKSVAYNAETGEYRGND